jgi:multimeric flavodoxin WrbA
MYMKLLAIIGSPKPNGNTYHAVKLVEDRLMEKSADIEFELIQLSKLKLDTCKGCYLCLSAGEERCPIKDERENLEMKLQQADAVIFASPVYTYNVSWIMKNFLDRFAYRCHRPDFHGKKAMVIATTGAVGLGFVIMLMSFMLGAMGFIISAKAGITYSPLHEKNDKRTTKEMKRLQKQTDNFFIHIMNTDPVKPSLLKLIVFKKQQKAFAKAPQNQADFQFWNNKEWLEKKERYYYKVHVNPIKYLVASGISKIL